MRFRNLLVLGASLVLATVGSAASVAAQEAAATQPASVTCESKVGKRQQCPADTAAGVAFAKQTRPGSCVLGETWGFDATGIWVSEGCGGVFTLTDDRPTVTCTTQPGARQACEADTSAGVSLAAQAAGSAPCLLGKSWGFDEKGVWVADGCSATFALSERLAVACASEAGGRVHCPADTSAGVVLVRTASTTTCVLGDSWGYDATGVWVDRGCRAEFVLGDTGAPAPGKVDPESRYGDYEVYGRVVAHAAFYNDEIEMQDNASWLGARFSTRGAIKVFGHVEWGVNLLQNDVNFNAGASTESGFLTILPSQAGQVFSARLGYVGLDLGPAGQIAFGKQWAVHYDVASYTTDQFDVFGGQASMAYPAGSDGGDTGTGRVNKALTYRNTLWILDVGVQAQFRNVYNNEVIDGLGASAQLTLLPGVKAGVTYTETNTRTLIDRVRGLSQNPRYFAIGGRIDWPLVELGAVVSRQWNGDLRYVATPTPADAGVLETVVFNGDGLELFGKVKFPGFALIGGFIDYRPRDLDPLIDAAFRTRYVIAGAQLHIAKSAYAYAEARLFDDSVSPSGEDGFNVFTLGFQYGFSFTGMHRP